MGKIKIEAKEVTEYADELGVELKVRERKPATGTGFVYSARYHETYEKKGGVLHGHYGVGKTPDEAIADYAEKVSGKLMAVDAFSYNRQDVTFPKLIHTKMFIKEL